MAKGNNKKSPNQMDLAIQNIQIEDLIHTIRGEKVILDNDLARLYGVTTKVLNQAIKRNKNRFPSDFLFQLTPSEKQEVVTNCDHLAHLRFSPVNPFAFTEQGAIMASNVLNSIQAVKMSVFVVRAFVKIRATLAHNTGLAGKLAALEKEITSRLDLHESAIVDVLQRIMNILDPPPEPEPPRPPIGFHVKPEPDQKPKGRRK